MRIGVDARYAYRRQRRGIGEYIRNLLIALESASQTDEFYLYVDADVFDDALLPSDRFHLRRLAVRNPLAFEELYLPPAARRDGLDVLHLTSNYGCTTHPCPTVYTIHDVIELRRGEAAPWQQDLRHWAGRKIRMRTLPLQAKRASAVITPSEWSRRDIQRVLHVDPHKIHVIFHGAPDISPATDREAVAQSLQHRGYPVPEKVLVAFAALDPRKNGKRVIEAFTRISRKFPDVELWLLGIESLDALALGELHQIRTFGFLPREDAVDILRCATGLIYASLYEGFGMPALEAMSAGIPLIASTASSIPEITGTDACLQVDPYRVEELSAAMVQLLRNSELRASLSKKGLERAKRFRWDRSALEHLEVYRACLPQKS